VEVAPSNGPLAADRRYQEVIAGLAEQFKWQAVLDLDIAWRKKIHRDLATRDNFAYHLVDATLIATFCNAAQAKATGSKAPAGTSTEFRSASGGALNIVRTPTARETQPLSVLLGSVPPRPPMPAEPSEGLLGFQRRRLLEPRLQTSTCLSTVWKGSSGYNMYRNVSYRSSRNISTLTFCCEFLCCCLCRSMAWSAMACARCPSILPHRCMVNHGIRRPSRVVNHPSDLCDDATVSVGLSTPAVSVIMVPGVRWLLTNVCCLYVWRLLDRMRRSRTP